MLPNANNVSNMHIMLYSEQSRCQYYSHINAKPCELWNMLLSKATTDQTDQLHSCFLPKFLTSTTPIFFKNFPKALSILILKQCVFRKNSSFGSPSRGFLHSQWPWVLSKLKWGQSLPAWLQMLEYQTLQTDSSKIFFSNSK